MCVIYILHIICMYSLCDMYIDDIIHACMSCVILLIDTHTAILSYYICIHIHICIYTYYIYTYYIYIYIYHIYTHAALCQSSHRVAGNDVQSDYAVQYALHACTCRAHSRGEYLATLLQARRRRAANPIPVGTMSDC